MCAAFESMTTVYRPGRMVAAWLGSRFDRAIWGGFARSERLSWWLKQGCEPVDIPAVRFAERSSRDGRLHWGDVPDGYVIRGLWERASGGQQILVLTRSASMVERNVFGHHRMPALEKPIYSSAPIAIDAGPDGRPAQMELF